MDKYHNILQKWRDEDQADSITLSRHEVVELLEEYLDLLDSRQELYKLVMM